MTDTTLIGQLVIFKDPSYVILGGIGAVVSIFGATHYMLLKYPPLSGRATFAVLLKALFVGLVSVPITYMALDSTGTFILEKWIGLPVGTVVVVKSLWFLLSIATAWYAVPMFDYVAHSICSKLNKKKGVKC